MTKQPASTRLNSPQTFFLYCLLVIVLFISMNAFISMFGAFIDFVCEFKTAHHSFSDGFYWLQSSISSIIIAYPILCIVSFLLIKAHMKNPADNLTIKNWFTYFIGFVASIIILFCLVRFLYYFLSDSLTLRFVMKTTVTCLIAFASVLFYFAQLKKLWTKRATQIFAYSISVIVMVLTGISIYIFKTSPQSDSMSFYPPATGYAFSAKDMLPPAEPMPYCKQKSLKATTTEDEIMQKIIAHYVRTKHCKIGNNCLLKWNDKTQTKFSLAWESCNLGDGSTFTCTNIANKVCCSLLGGDNFTVCE